jgi:hypothetical protein
MMKLSQEQEKKVLVGVFTALVLLIVYRAVTAEKPKTVPLVYQRGSVAHSSVRQGLASPASGADPLAALLAKREEKFPGVSRDIFRMENPAPPPKQKKVSPVVAAPPPPPPPPPQKTPEEIAAELSRSDLSKFRFLGYLTEKDNSLFLSKDGELFIVKIGDRILKTYQVKEASKDSVILLDTATRVEVRVDLSGGEAQQAPLPGPRPPQQPMPQLR